MRPVLAAALGATLACAACAPKEYVFSMDGAGAVYTDLLPEQVAIPAPSSDPIAVPMEVVIDDALRSSQWQFAIDADRMRMPVGVELTERLDDVARNVFPDVLVTKQRTALDRAVLRPRLIAFERTLPHFGNGSALPVHRSSIVVEWRFEAPDGRLVWVETVTATGEQSPDDEVQPRRAAVRRMFESLYAESQRRLEAAPELRAYEEQLRASAIAAKRTGG